jgi:hypothetical protein
MRSSLAFFFLLSIILFLFPSGCVEREKVTELYISNVDVMSIPQDVGSKLTVTVYVSNQQNKDTGTLSIKVKARDPQTNLVVGEQSKDIGYIKAKSQATTSVSLKFQNAGQNNRGGTFLKIPWLLMSTALCGSHFLGDENVPSVWYSRYG